MTSNFRRIYESVLAPLLQHEVRAGREGGLDRMPASFDESASRLDPRLRQCPARLLRLSAVRGLPLP